MKIYISESIARFSFHGIRLMTLALLLGISAHLKADIINPNVLELRQPDGTGIELRFKGSGKVNWYEDLLGFPVQKIGNTYYYQQALDPTLAPGPLLEVGKSDPKAEGVKRITPQERYDFLEANGLLPSPNPLEQGPQGVVQPVLPIGSVKNLVILIKFADHASRPLPSQADFDTLFNAVGGDPTIAPTGSIRDIYLENSYGQFTLDSTIVDWFTVPQSEAYYADGISGLVGNVPEALVSALNNADTLIDFSQFDSDSDGFIDAITFVHSGYGAEWGGTDAFGADFTDRIWSHKSGINTWTSNESVSVSDYNINPGLWSTSGAAIGRVGVIAHELGHFFGLPDLYDYSQPGNGLTGAGIGSWGMMANSWGFTGDQLNPPHMSAWSKIELGWVTPTILATPGTYTANAVELNPQIYRVDSGFPSGEYLLLENRQPIGVESTIPQGGMAIWHIDENRSNNTDQSYPPLPDWPAEHYRIALLQADGLYDLEKDNNRGDAGDVYHGGGVSNIDQGTTPSTDGYQSGSFIPSNIAISDVSPGGNSMDFTFGGIPPVDPTFIYPAGGEVFTQGTSEIASWDTNGALSSTDYTLAVGRSCLATTVFVEDVETLPANLVSTNDSALGNHLWFTDSTNPFEGASHWHALDPTERADQYLTSALITIPDINPELSFWHSYNMESPYDGGVIEASLDGSNWLDLGNKITSNPYDVTLQNTDNPLGGRQAFSGNSPGYINTVVDLSIYAGLDIYFRFRLGSDSSVGATGWDIDLVEISGASPVMSFLGTTTGNTFPWNITESPGTDYCMSLQGSDSNGSSNIVYSNLFDIDPATITTCNDLTVTVDFNLGQEATSASDVILGTPGPDIIRGKAGDDTICGGGGDDFIHGNSGDDWIDGGEGVDDIRGGNGNDLLFSGPGATVGSGSRVFGGDGDDEITGGADADDLRGGRGIDTINGKGGNDLIYGNDNGDFLLGGTGFDTVNGGQGDDDLKGGADDDQLSGGGGNDILNGGAGSSDNCDGGSGSGDSATASCESVSNVP